MRPELTQAQQEVLQYALDHGGLTRLTHPPRTIDALTRKGMLRFSDTTLHYEPTARAHAYRFGKYRLSEYHRTVLHHMIAREGIAELAGRLNHAPKTLNDATDPKHRGVRWKTYVALVRGIDPHGSNLGAEPLHPNDYDKLSGHWSPPAAPQEDLWVSRVRDYLAASERPYETTQTLLEGLGLTPDQIAANPELADVADLPSRRGYETRIGNAMRTLGWIKAKVRLDGKQKYVYLKPGG